jgi:hypothetical protein
MAPPVLLLNPPAKTRWPELPILSIDPFDTMKKGHFPLALKCVDLALLIDTFRPPVVVIVESTRIDWKGPTVGIISKWHSTCGWQMTMPVLRPFHVWVIPASACVPASASRIIHH